MKKQKIIITIIIMSLLALSACTTKIDKKNEQILERVFEIDKIDINKIEIKKDTIFVSMEASSAGEYDTQILEWWGTIFGIVGMLQGDYMYVIIENTVNGEAYAYISTNVYTIRDFTEDRISDAEFWDETLITASKPKTQEILRASGLPKETLKDEAKKTRTNTTLITIIVVTLILAILTLLLFKNKKRKKQKTETHIAPKKSKNKENINKIQNTIKTKTKKITEKTKQQTKKFKEKLKEEPGR